MPAEKFHHVRVAWLLLAAALLLTVVVYWPSLNGGYVFDDYPNIVQNRDVHVSTLDWKSLRRAALSSPSPLLVRPIAMLSFGVDWYIGGGDPRQMRAVNLAIHVLNGLLLFALLRRITRVAIKNVPRDRAELLAALVAAAWLLAPINFTAVGYVVQRMESLCQVFVLAGLLGYVTARTRMAAGRPGFAAAAAAVAIGTALGALCKESALLLPLYAFLLEWSVFDFRGSGPLRDRRLLAFYAFVLVIPGTIALVWALSRVLHDGAWASRPFTLEERLLTEPRVLIDYVRWSLLPTPNSLALYHDQIAPSKGWLDPATSLTSIAALLTAAGGAAWLRTARPLAALGIGWFLAAHLLTATIIPLELVFEHRNYFASIGLYLAVFSLLMPAASSRMAVARATTCVALLALFATVSWVRAKDWSNPVAFAMSEAEKNPNSPRTAYELGRTYVVLSQYRADSPFVARAYSALERAAAMPGSNALADQGVLMLSGRLRQPAPAGSWKRLQDKLATQPLASENISALYSLSQCAIDGDCKLPDDEMVQAFLAALKHSPPNPFVLSIYANYAINVLRDPTLALDLAQEAVRLEPASLQARRNLMLLLQKTGRASEAKHLYERTLIDLPGAGADEALREFADSLFNEPARPTTAAPLPQSVP